VLCSIAEAGLEIRGCCMQFLAAMFLLVADSFENYRVERFANKKVKHCK
jgi:hypothetical protein